MLDLFRPSAVSYVPAIAVHRDKWKKRLTAGGFEGASELSFIIQSPVVRDTGRDFLAKDLDHVCLCISDEAGAKDNNVCRELGSVVEGETCSGEMGHYSIGLHLDLVVDHIC